MTASPRARRARDGQGAPGGRSEDTAGAAAAFDDLAEGCDVCFAPAFDGGYYLVALAAPHPCVFDLPGDAWGGPQILELSLEAAAAAHLSLGMLRGERDLDTPADARAALADPLFPRDIAGLLR